MFAFLGSVTALSVILPKPWKLVVIKIETMIVFVEGIKPPHNLKPNGEQLFSQ